MKLLRNACPQNLQPNLPHQLVVPGKFEHLSLPHAQRIDLIKTCFGSLDVAEKKTCLKDLFLSSDNQTEQQLLLVLTDIYDKTTQNTSLDVLCNTLDTLFLKLLIKAGITSNPGNFSSLSIQAMKLLQDRGKSKLVYKFSLKTIYQTLRTEIQGLPLQSDPQRLPLPQCFH